ncbi:MAG: 2Fe-2S iron-sulfur cluster binding domain-containing protein [Bdellovibrionaceae bacterium]|nr:2Fe-2S iron-sulfur cluster binding domain-containing protein [Pseudobdellovibrionaceae bacterium]
MPRISFKKSRPSLEVPAGTNLMRCLIGAGLPVASSCNSEGVCAKCGIRILEGMQNLSSPNVTEIFLKEKNNIGGEIRISCQTQVLGDILVDASYW